MFKRQALIYVGIVVLSCLLAGCGVRPQVDFYVTPVATGAEQRIDEEARSVTKEDAGKKDVSITISALDTVDLLEVTSDPHINPYVYVGNWGIVRPRYTVFDVTVKNNSESESMANFSNAVLMDEEGEQYEAIPYEEFRERYGAYRRLEREIIYYPSPYVHHRPPYYSRGRQRSPWYYHYDRYGYRRPYYVRRVYDVAYLKRAVLGGTMLKPVKLYAGGKRQGFLVFPLVARDASELKIIFPSITTGEGRKLEFHFERIPAEK